MTLLIQSCLYSIDQLLTSYSDKEFLVFIQPQAKDKNMPMCAHVCTTQFLRDTQATHEEKFIP